ncbi:MAG: hypothetical protein R6V75_04715, partial [Bacteroidales bacterium]
VRDGKPDGRWVSYHVNGRVKSEGIRTNFELDSTWKFYDEEGNLTDEISYLNGKKSGFHNRYQQTLPLFKELYVDNIRQGLSYYYDQKGELERVVRYRDGKKHGLTREYRDGLVQVIYRYHNDFMIDREYINQTDARGLKQGVWREYYENDNIRSESHYKNGLLNGYSREYNQSGRLLSSRFYEEGKLIEEGIADEIQAEVRNRYDEDGNLISSGSFINNVPIGIHREYIGDKSRARTDEYDNSGQVVSTGITTDKGGKEEFWQFFYPGGQVRLEGNYRDDKRTGLWKFYYPNGELEQTGNYRNGLEEGLWTWYYPGGQVRREENYLRGREDGMSVEFDMAGEEIARGEFIEGLEEGAWYLKVGDQVEKGSYQAGLRQGIWRHYFANGTLKFEGSYIQGNPEGRHRYFHENGKIKEEQFYRMGSKEKTWWVFDQDGNVVISYVYSNDLLLRVDGIRVNLEID